MFRKKKLRQRQADYAAMFVAAQLSNDHIRGSAKDRVDIAWKLAEELVKRLEERK